MKPSYYRMAIETILDIKKSICPPDFRILFDIQTNGTLINQDWCDLLTEYDGLLTIGISCDGPAQLHDRYRKSWAGNPTHKLTHAGMELLCKNNIKFDITAVVSQESLEQPVEFLNYFSQFTEFIREFHFNLHDELFIDSVDKREIERYACSYKHFLRSLLNTISINDREKFPKIRNFTSFFNRIFVDDRDRPEYDARSMSKPFKTLSVEANGDVTTFYAGLTVDECRDLKDLYGDGKGLVVGNILRDSIDDIAESNKLKKISGDFEISHQACEAGCEYYDLCSGGYNLIKYRRYSTFTETQTPECFVHVMTFADTLLNELNQGIEASQSSDVRE